MMALSATVAQDEADKWITGKLKDIFRCDSNADRLIGFTRALHSEPAVVMSAAVSADVKQLHVLAGAENSRDMEQLKAVKTFYFPTSAESESTLHKGIWSMALGIRLVPMSRVTSLANHYVRGGLEQTFTFVCFCV